MGRTKLTSRAKYNHRKEDYQRCRVRSGVKNIEGRIRNRHKQINPQSQNIEAKKNGQVVRRMTERRKALSLGYGPVKY